LALAPFLMSVYSADAMVASGVLPGMRGSRPSSSARLRGTGDRSVSVTGPERRAPLGGLSAPRGTARRVQAAAWRGSKRRRGAAGACARAWAASDVRVPRRRPVATPEAARARARRGRATAPPPAPRRSSRRGVSSRRAQPQRGVQGTPVAPALLVATAPGSARATHRVMLPVVISRRSRRSTSTAADLKMPARAAAVHTSLRHLEQKA
jgi:hypothetical protein